MTKMSLRTLVSSIYDETLFHCYAKLALPDSPMEAWPDNDEDYWKWGSDNIQSPFLEETIVDNTEAHPSQNARTDV